VHSQDLVARDAALSVQLREEAVNLPDIFLTEVSFLKAALVKYLMYPP